VNYEVIKIKVHTKYLMFNTKKRMDFINITDKIEKAIEESQVEEGLVLINPMHITAAIYVNDAESGLIEDFKVWLEKLAPSGLNYNHHMTGEDNADAHLKRQLMGHQVTMPITNGSLDLGTWEQIYYAEFDGQRQKRVLVKIIGM
jgi:secondary thiamine-phosphate synthase enzyme